MTPAPAPGPVAVPVPSLAPLPVTGPGSRSDVVDVYALGSDPEERARLQRQSQELRPESVALLSRIGLRAGQSALDLGCGPSGSSTCSPPRSQRTGAWSGWTPTPPMSRWPVDTLTIADWTASR